LPRVISTTAGAWMSEPSAEQFGGVLAALRRGRVNRLFYG
jgi:hypothetical protein